MKNLIVVAYSFPDDPWDINIQECWGESELDKYKMQCWEDASFDEMQELIVMSDSELLDSLEASFTAFTEECDMYLNIHPVSSYKQDHEESLNYRANNIRLILKQWLNDQ